MNTSTFSWRAASTSAISRRRASFPLSASAQAASPSQCEGWLQICLKRVRNARISPLRAIPSVARDPIAELLHRLRVERRLLAAEGAEGLDLGLVREVGDHRAVGLEPPQDVGADELPQRREGAVGPRGEALREGRELLRGAEQAGVHEVEERPQVGEAVLDGRAGEGDPRPAGELLGRPRLAGAGVLDGLRLVEDDEVATRRLEPRQPQQRAVAGDRRGRRRGAAPAGGPSARRRAGPRGGRGAPRGRARSGSTSATQLARSEAGATSRLGRRPAPASRLSTVRSASTWIVLPRPMSSARHAPRPSL